MRVAVVIPALNEAETVASIVREVARFAHPIVVDDGSSDATAAQAESAGAEVLRNPHNQGYDAALRSGFDLAYRSGFDVIASIDADAELAPAALERVLEPVTRWGWSMALGVRTRRARWSEVVCSRWSRLRFGVPDLLCGAKAFSAATYARYADAMAGPTIGTGLAVAALRGGERAALVLIPVQRRADRPRFGSGLGPNLQILRATAAHIGYDARARRNRAVPPVPDGDAPIGRALADDALSELQSADAGAGGGQGQSIEATRTADLRRQFAQHGWVVQRSVFRSEEIERLRGRTAAAIARAHDRQTVLVEDGPEGRLEWGIGDLLSYDELREVVLDPRVLSLAEAVLGAPPVYFGDSTFRVGVNGMRAWHRDNIDRDFDGPDWDGSYPAVRLGLYLQDHERHSGGLTLRDGSHIDAREHGRARFVDSRAGDLLAWSLRTRHAAEAVRIKTVPSVVLNPRLQSRVPAWARRPEPRLRMTLFITYGARHPLLERYIAYLSTRDYMIESLRASHYSDETLRLVSRSGLELVGPLQSLAAGS
jgi:glycosyltransferase involved in cell wall biosynthesis